MKFLRFGPKGAERPGALAPDGTIHDISSLVEDIVPETIGRLHGITGADIARLPVVPASERIGACVGRPGKFVCIGLNYSDHAAETGAEVPDEPIIFMKAVTAVTGPNDDIYIPPGSQKTDWEVELGIVIGEVTQHVSAEQADKHILGYCLINDVSERHYQVERGGTWDKGKGYDTFGPIGPWLVTRDEIADPHDLRMWLDVDGHRYQHGSTQTMIFGVYELVSYVSQFMTLMPGDIISTGTPPGVGLGQKPPVFLRPGQTMRLGIDHLGEQVQRTGGFPAWQGDCMTGTARELTLAGLRQLGLVAPGENAELVPLTGGVASDIWLVRGTARPFAVKRALEKLRVAADWHAPVSRNASEVAWLNQAARAAPHAVPHILAHDAELGFFAMDFLEPETHPVWKRELSQGRADPAFAADVGRTLAAIHASTANRPEIAGDFNDDALFRALRIEPYLDYTASRHPEIAGALRDLGARTLTTHRALVHGDISPKNILMGPRGPVFLDAECAWYGDPAFDLAFCLNHLLLKCLWNPDGTAGFLAGFDKLVSGYLEGVTWEDPADLSARAAALLPALLLARIDGKSPVEYITEAAPKAFVRQFSIPLIATPPATPASIRQAWSAALAQGAAQ